MSVRKSDFLCRYGGDEFIIVTPAPECEGNEELIARIRENLDDWNRQYASIGYDLSFSMGCAVWEKGRDLMDVTCEFQTSARGVVASQPTEGQGNPFEVGPFDVGHE